MKTFVRAKADYRDILEKGELYEVVTIFKTLYLKSGTAVVIIDDDDDLTTIDSGFFE